MKKYTIIFLWLLLPTIVSAQSPDFDSLMKKYEGTEGVTTFSITGKMLQTLSKNENSALSDIESLSVIIPEDEKGPNKRIRDDLRSDLTAFLAKGRYEEVYSFSEDGTVVKIYFATVKKTHRYIYSVKENAVLECIVYLQGNVDIGQVRKITSGLKK